MYLLYSLEDDATGRHLSGLCQAAGEHPSLPSSCCFLQRGLDREEERGPSADGLVPVTSLPGAFLRQVRRTLFITGLPRDTKKETVENHFR